MRLLRHHRPARRPAPAGRAGHLLRPPPDDDGLDRGQRLHPRPAAGRAGSGDGTGPVPADPDDPYIAADRAAAGPPGRWPAATCGSCSRPWARRGRSSWRGRSCSSRTSTRPPWYVDGMLTQLEQAGKLAGVAGVAVGDMERCEWSEQRARVAPDQVAGAGPGGAPGAARGPGAVQPAPRPRQAPGHPPPRGDRHPGRRRPHPHRRPAGPAAPGRLDGRRPAPAEPGHGRAQPRSRDGSAWTGSPSTRVARTRAPAMGPAAGSNGSRSRTARSASLPGVTEPVSASRRRA